VLCWCGRKRGCRVATAAYNRFSRFGSHKTQRVTQSLQHHAACTASRCASSQFPGRACFLPFCAASFYSVWQLSACGRESDTCNCIIADSRRDIGTPSASSWSAGTVASRNDMHGGSGHVLPGRPCNCGRAIVRVKNYFYKRGISCASVHPSLQFGHNNRYCIETDGSVCFFTKRLFSTYFIHCIIRKSRFLQNNGTSV